MPDLFLGEEVRDQDGVAFERHIFPVGQLLDSALGAVFRIAVDDEDAAVDVEDPVFGDACARLKGGLDGEVEAEGAVCYFDEVGELVAAGMALPIIGFKLLENGNVGLGFAKLLVG